MHDGVLRTYQLEFVFMTVVPDSRPFSLFIKKSDTAGYALCCNLNDLDVGAINNAFTGWIDDYKHNVEREFLIQVSLFLLFLDSVTTVK